MALRGRFARVWPQARQLLLDHLLVEAGEGHEGAKEAAEALKVRVERAQPKPAPPKEPEIAEEPEVAEPEPEPEPEPEEAPAPPEEAPAEPEAPRAAEEEARAPYAEAPVRGRTKRPGGKGRSEAEQLSPEVRELPFLRRDLAQAYPTHEPDLLEDWLERAVLDLAAMDAPVVVLGPPGSGKEFLARRMHARSELGRGPFITFSASSCPPSLWALELFGDADAYGHLTAALGGTLFVEDAGVLEDALLDRLLRELPKQREPVRLVLSVRLAPGEDPQGFIGAAGGLLGELMRGLLANQVVVVPPLADRGVVLGRIADHYMMRWSMKHNRVITSMDPATFEVLRRHRWPAGVTELKAILEAAVLRCDGQRLLPEHIGLAGGAPSGGVLVDLDELSQATEDLKALLRDVQTAVYLEAYNREQGNKTAAARQVGVKRSTYVRRLKQILGEE